jgi:hypothetical protein
LKRFLLLALVASCVNPASQFDCSKNPTTACVAADGTHGACQVSGNCAFPDPSCGDGGLRYDDTAGPGRSHICVLSPGGTTTVALQPISQPHALLFEITTPPQMITFDTEVQDTSVLVSLHWFTGFCPPASPTEAGSMPQTCGNQIVDRISVMVQTPGPYCLVATDDHPNNASDAIGLRVFPSVTPPACIE